jgi:diguanylate cyclase (GGDEF)-like protein
VPSIGDYELTDKVGETKTSVAYRARQGVDGPSRIIKVLRARSPSASDLARFHHEYKIIKAVDIDGVVKTYDIISCEQGIALVLEDFEGISLKGLIHRHRLSVATFLQIAVKVSEALGHLHAANIIHMDIKPHNILYNPVDGRTKITDFGISHILTYSGEYVDDQDAARGTIAYMSPEQTGRINRSIDYRSDLYSLGVTCFEMLTSSLPFDGIDAREIVHGHIAKVAPCVRDVNPDVPLILSDMVAKLLAKDAEERYQNSYGLMSDLEECQKRWEQTREIAPFALAGRDIPLKFSPPERLVGRDRELEELLAAFHRARDGTSEITLVVGPPGVGKSALIHEIYRQILVHQGYFVSGKCDRLKRDRPYGALAQAFQALMRQILNEDSARTARWRHKLSQALGPNGQVITEIIPDVELLVGEQPALPELSAEETEHRFHYVFGRFLKVFATREHPLVIFLDDLQWIDFGSLKLLSKLLADRSAQYLFLVCAYRNTEVPADHPVALAFDTLRRDDVTISRIDLAPLDMEHVLRFLAEFLRCDEDDVLPLAHIIWRKTNGNPFFMNQLIRTLHREGLLMLDPLQGWRWNNKDVEAVALAENVVALLVDKIQRLTKRTRDTLKVCAAIGSSFSLETLADVTQLPTSGVLDRLTEARAEGLIQNDGEKFCFCHDHIQEAAHSLLSSQEKKEIHLAIGNLALRQAGDDERERNIFCIVNHLNRAGDLAGEGISGGGTELARLNVVAAQKAKRSAAYAQALDYLCAAATLLGDEGWSKDYETTATVHIEAAETAYLCSEHAVMQRFSAAASREVRSAVELVKIEEIRSLSYTARNRPQDCIDASLQALRLVHIRFPSKPGKLRVALAILATQLRLWNWKQEELLALPEMTTPQVLAGVRVMAKMSPTAYWTMPTLLPFLVLKALRLSLKYGNCPDTAYAYCSFAIFLCHVGQIDKGYYYSRVGLALLHQRGEADQIPRTNFLVNTYVNHWKEHVRETLDPFIENHQKSLEVGEVDFACHSLLMYCIHSFYAGRELGRLHEEVTRYHEVLRGLRQRMPQNAMAIFCETIRCLLDQEQCREELVGELYDEKIMLAEHLAVGDRTSVCNLYVNKLILCYLKQDYQQAVRWAAQAETVLEAVLATYIVPVFHLYCALAHIGLCGQEKSDGRRRLLRLARRSARKLQVWARHCPENHGHKAALVQAELARVTGQPAEATAQYEQALEGARENRFVNEEALALELSGRFHLGRGNSTLANHFISGAIFAYNRWGAKAKVAMLEREFPQHMALVGQAADRGSSQSSARYHTVTIDVAALRELLETIVHERSHGLLVERTLAVAMETAGAQRAILVLRQGSGEFQIEGERAVERPGTPTVQSVPLAEFEGLAHPVVNYVRRTSQRIVVDNAQEEVEEIPSLRFDRYVKSCEVKSILCLPIRTVAEKDQSIVGLLYLENNVTTGAFSADTVEMVQIIGMCASYRLELSRRATTDELTGLYNQCYFEQILTTQFALCRHQGTALSVIMANIDHFNKLKTFWGIRAADALLEAVAATVRGACREHDVPARYGGEQIVLILPERSLEEAAAIAEELRQQVEAREVEGPEGRLSVTVSFGVAAMDDQTLESQDLTRAAKEALCCAKEQGRNQVARFRNSS